MIDNDAVLSVPEDEPGHGTAIFVEQDEDRAGQAWSIEHRSIIMNSLILKDLYITSVCVGWLTEGLRNLDERIIQWIYLGWLLC